MFIVVVVFFFYNCYVVCVIKNYFKFLLLQDLHEFFSLFFPDQFNMSPGAIFGIVAGVVVAVGINVVVAVCCFSKKKMAAKCSTETAIVEVVLE